MYKENNGPDKTKLQTKKHRSIVTKYIVALILSAMYFVFHLHYMQQFMDWDQTAYLNNILNSFKPGRYPTYNPHHIHFELGGKIFHELIMANLRNKESTDITFNNRIRSLLAACIGIFFAVLFLKNVTGRIMWGVIGGLLVGLCHGYLHYATKVDTAIFPTAGLIVTLWIFNKLENAEKYIIPLSIITGLILSIDIVFHQLMVFVCFSLVISIMLPSWLFQKNNKFSPFVIYKENKNSKIHHRHRFRFLAVIFITMTTVILVSGVYFKAGISEYNLSLNNKNRSGGRGRFWYYSFQRWLFMYEFAPYWGNGFTEFNPKSPFRGFTDSFVSQRNKRIYRHNAYYRFSYNLKNLFHEKHITHNSVAFFCLFSFFGSLLFIPFMLRRYGRILFIFFLCILLFSVFNTYWEGYHLEFWLMPCVLVCFLGIFILNLIGEKLQLILKNVSQFPGYAIIITFIFILFSHNIEYYLYPYSIYKKLETVNLVWEPDYYMKLFSTVIYKNPDNPYKDIYGIEKVPPVRIPVKKDIEDGSAIDYSEYWGIYSAIDSNVND